MLAEMVKHTIGIDPDRDWITASVVDTATTGELTSARFGTTRASSSGGCSLVDCRGRGGCASCVVVVA